MRCGEAGDFRADLCLGLSQRFEEREFEDFEYSQHVGDAEVAHDRCQGGFNKEGITKRVFCPSPRACGYISPPCEQEPAPARWHPPSPMPRNLHTPMHRVGRVGSLSEEALRADDVPHCGIELQVALEQRVCQRGSCRHIADEDVHRYDIPLSHSRRQPRAIRVGKRWFRGRRMDSSLHDDIWSQPESLRGCLSGRLVGATPPARPRLAAAPLAHFRVGAPTGTKS
jgi:hypothetical protein